MAMPKEKTLTAFSQLLGTLRLNSKSNKPSALQIELLMHVAIKPRTYEELVLLTGTHNGRISRAVMGMTPVIENKELVKPDIHLLNRKMNPGSRKYEVSLSKTGKSLLREAGLIL